VEMDGVEPTEVKLWNGPRMPLQEHKQWGYADKGRTPQLHVRLHPNILQTVLASTITHFHPDIRTQNMALLCKPGKQHPVIKLKRRRPCTGRLPDGTK